jgi:hypothetical protein
MEFQINVQEFLAGIQPVVDIATKGVNKDFASAEKITLEATVNGIIATAHNGLAFIRSLINNDKYPNLKYVLQEAGIATVAANTFFGGVNSLRYSPEMKIILKDGQLVSSVPYYNQQKEEDGENYQSAVVYKDSVVSPVLAKEFKSEVTVNREIFVDGMEKINFAIGFEENQPYYMCQVFDADVAKATFVSGTGGRFAVKKFVEKGENSQSIVQVKNKTRIIFPHHSISNITKILGNAASNKIKIKEALQTKESPDQIIIEFNNTILVILGIDAEINYPNYNKILEETEYPYQVQVKLEDWGYVTEGIDVTYSKEMKANNEIHNSEITAEFDKKRFFVQTHTKDKAGRFVGFEEQKTDGKVKTSFRCNSIYLSELISRGYKEGQILVKFKDEKTPILVDFPEKTNEMKGVLERFSVLFSTSRK